jgi:hypothetical protein
MLSFQKPRLTAALSCCYGVQGPAQLLVLYSTLICFVQAVWALEQKRRDNDRKILALHMEMKEMMGVLTQCVQLASIS